MGFTSAPISSRPASSNQQIQPLAGVERGCGGGCTGANLMILFQIGGIQHFGAGRAFAPQAFRHAGFTRCLRV